MKKKENQQANTAPEEAVQDPVNQDGNAEMQAEPDAQSADQGEATVEQWQAAL